MAPRSIARGTAKRDGQPEGMPIPRDVTMRGAIIPLQGRIFLRKKLLLPTRSCPILPQPGWDGALRAVCLVRLLAKGINHSRCRLSRIPSGKATVAPAEICSAVP